MDYIYIYYLFYRKVLRWSEFLQLFVAANTDGMTDVVVDDKLVPKDVKEADLRVGERWRTLALFMSVTVTKEMFQGAQLRGGKDTVAHHFNSQFYLDGR
jgi:hypothetical protein